jgi:CRISPR-associated protein Cas1
VYPVSQQAATDDEVLIDLDDFYFTGDDYRYRFKVEAKERFIALLRGCFNAGVMWKRQRLQWDTVIEQKTNELGRFLIGKERSVEFMEPAPHLEREDNGELRTRILALTSPQARRLGIGKSTLHNLRLNAKADNSFAVYAKVKRKLN